MKGVHTFGLGMLLLSLTGCLKEPFRPVATAGRLGSETLACDDVSVHLGNSQAWGRDPHGRYDAYLVRGCGREQWFACQPAFAAGGSCAPIPMGPYVSPPADAPHGVLFTELQHRRLRRTAVGERELLVVGDRGWVVRERHGPAPGIPLRPGVHMLHWSAKGTDVETLHHASASAYGVHEWTTRHPVPGEGCARRFELTVRAGARYRLRLDMSDLDTCSFTCVQDELVQGVRVTTPCEGTLLDDTAARSVAAAPTAAAPNVTAVTQASGMLRP